MPEQSGLSPVLSVEEVNALMEKAYPQLGEHLRPYQAIAIGPGGCIVRLDADDRHLRPGGTVSGPALFTLADIGGYVCVLSHAGPDALSVTTNININFMRKAEAGPIDGALPHPQARPQPDGVRHRHRGRTEGRDGRFCHGDVFDSAEAVRALELERDG